MSEQFYKELDIGRTNMKETGREDGKLQPEELAALLQRLEKLELQHRKDLEKWKILKKIQEVKAMLEQNKKRDESQQRGKHLQRLVETGKATKDTYDEMCDIENNTRERVLDSIERAPKYDGNPEIMFEWCENLETHLRNDDWETEKDIK